MVKRLTFTDSNQSQQYATHDFFRYFGKLPPVVVRHILEKAAPKDEPFIDLMCGSGTSLVESKFLGIEAYGVDVNPLSTLISRVKTTQLEPKTLCSKFSDLIAAIQDDAELISSAPSPFDAPLEYLVAERPTFRNKSHWFTSLNEALLIVVRHHVNGVEDQSVRDFFRVAFFSIIRRASNASERIGRIYLDKDVEPGDVIELFSSRVKNMIRGMEEFNDTASASPVFVKEVDARDTGFRDEQFGFILNHPPYFALYKYSSDVLRFELEWGGFHRSKISRQEVREGFKTTDIGKFQEYANDMEDVFQEAYRILRPGRSFCVVVNDSTLRDERLPVVETFIELAEAVGFTLAERFARDVMYSQARYHKSANSSIQTTEDQLLFFSK